MKKYCSVCYREISTNSNGKIYRHGFKKNRWIFSGKPKLKNVKYRKVDGSPCKGSGKIGLTLKQIERKKNACDRSRTMGKTERRQRRT